MFSNELRSEHRGNDDLLTAGLGLAGLRNMAPPAFADAAAPTAADADAFIAAVAPRLALVQAGYRNRYGHPAPEVVQRYRVAGTEVVDSSACGAARWDSARPQQMQCERTLQRRYWQHAGGR